MTAKWFINNGFNFDKLQFVNAIEYFHEMNRKALKQLRFILLEKLPLLIWYLKVGISICGRRTLKERVILDIIIVFSGIFQFLCGKHS